MHEPKRYVDPEHGIELELPAGWSARPDAEQGGTEISAESGGAGALHLLALPQPDDGFPDPAEELYAFLDDQGVELEEDEVEDLELPDGAEMALCEYIVASDDEDGDGDDDETFWLVGVATAPGQLVFATYLCAAEDADGEREAVRAILTSLRLRGAGEA